MPGSASDARGSADFHCGATSVPCIDAAALVEMMESGSPVVIVDVRTRCERSVAMIPGSIGVEEFERELASGAFRDAIVVAACTVGRRSGRYADRLESDVSSRDLCKEVRNSMGIVEYSHHPTAYGDGPHALVDAAGHPAARLHVFASPWDLGSDRFVPVRFAPLQAIAVSLCPAWFDATSSSSPRLS